MVFRIFIYNFLHNEFLTLYCVYKIRLERSNGEKKIKNWTGMKTVTIYVHVRDRVNAHNHDTPFFFFFIYLFLVRSHFIFAYVHSLFGVGVVVCR